MTRKPKGRVLNTPDPKAIGGARSHSNEGEAAHQFLWAGRVIHVDTETMVCSVAFDTGVGERHDVPIPAMAGGGPRSWAGSIIDKGSKVVLGWKRFGNRSYVPYIVSVLSVGTFPAREYEPFSSIDPAESKAVIDEIPEILDDPHVNLGVIRLKARKGYPGDFIASSSSGADIIIDRDVLLTNRAGNEIVIRDSDQTIVVQTLNEFTSNAAGYYRRGLIKRNAFNFLPDVFGLTDPFDVSSPFDIDNTTIESQKISQDSPAYEILLNFGLINEDGTKNFDDPLDFPTYPYVVPSDGQRISYVTQGEVETSFAETQFCYVEDRMELRHISDGIQTVNEEGDGFQIDPPFPVFIERVDGTVVGNDFHSEAGRPLYKRILTMKVFSDVNQKFPSDGPTFEAIDTVTDYAQVDSKSLAHLYRILSPNGSNQYVFGINKEGRVFLHVPKSRSGDASEKGKSIDANIQGLLKAVFGSDENSGRKSIDISTLGGVDLDIGRDSDGNSINLTISGKIKKTFTGSDNQGISDESNYMGSTLRTVAGSHYDNIGGHLIQQIGGSHSVEATSITHNSGPGGYRSKVAGDNVVTVLGKTNEQYAQLHLMFFALGTSRLSIAGIDSSTVLAGSIARTLVAGVSMTDTVFIGNMIETVAAGNMLMTVGVGSMSATVGSGALTLTCAAGPATLASALVTSVLSTTMNNLSAPFTKIGATTVGFAVAGVPGPPAPHLDYITGIPILGVPTVAIGL